MLRTIHTIFTTKDVDDALCIQPLRDKITMRRTVTTTSDLQTSEPPNSKGASHYFILVLSIPDIQPL